MIQASWRFTPRTIWLQDEFQCAGLDEGKYEPNEHMSPGFRHPLSAELNEHPSISDLLFI